MKPFCTCAVAGCLLLAAATLHAQIIMHIAPGGQLFINAKTAVSFDSLVMIPSFNGFLLGENDISKLATPNNPFEGNSIKRVYCFSHPVTNYNGSLGIFYNEGEMGDLNVNKLQLQAYSDNSWHPLAHNKARNARRNTVGVLGAHHLSFSELLLGYGLDTLPADPDTGSRVALIALLPKMDASLTVAVYPNPATSVINVQIGGTPVVRSVKLYDASGKLLMLKADHAGSRYSFNVGGLAGGYYTIAIETINGILSKGFMKN